MSTARFLAETSLSVLLNDLPGQACYVSQQKPNGTDYDLWNVAETKVAHRHKRPASSLKSFFLPIREKVALFWGPRGEKIEVDRAAWSQPETVIFAVLVAVSDRRAGDDAAGPLLFDSLQGKQILHSSMSVPSHRTS